MSIASLFSSSLLLTSLLSTSLVTLGNYVELISAPGISSGDNLSIVGKYSFDVPNGNMNSGTKLVIWHSHAGENQQFTTDNSANGGPTPIRIDNKCVDAFGGLNVGTSIGIWDCHGGENQQWDVVKDPQTQLPRGTVDITLARPATFSIRPRDNHNYCIDAAGSLTAGTQLILWPCHGGLNQRWIPRNGTNIAYNN